jgi:hypothetical protein
MASFETYRKTAFLQNTTPRVTFQIVDEDGVGFRPGTLTMSVYDLDFHTTSLTVQQWISHPIFPIPASQTIVNDRQDIDMLAFCDVNGFVEFHLDEEDTEIGVPSSSVPSLWLRNFLFTWTWASPPRKGKHQLILTIAPDRASVAV